VRLAESLAALQPLRVALDLVQLMGASGASARAVAAPSKRGRRSALSLHLARLDFKDDPDLIG